VILGRLPWLPDRLLDHALPSAAVQHVLERARRTAERFEHLVRPRLLPLTGSPLVNSVHGVTLVVVVLLLMAPLPLVPFANTLPAIAIILICLGIAERDGALLIGGYVVSLVSTVYIGALLWLVVHAGMNVEDVYGTAQAFMTRLFGS